MANYRLKQKVVQPSDANNRRADAPGAAITQHSGHQSSTSRGLESQTVEDLGRQRPTAFEHWWSEVGFVFTIVTSMMMSEYFIAGFNITLPPIVEALSIPPTSRTWPSAVTSLTTAALLQPFARLCDLWGGRLVLISGQTWLLGWSLISGFSTNAVMLIICRAMQGIGAAAFLPAGLSLLGRTYRPGPRKNLIFAVYGSFACIGFYIGILVGALSAEYLTWKWYFWIGSILCFVVITSGWLTIPEKAVDLETSATMDWIGAATIVPGLVLIVFALTDGGQAPNGWKTPYIYTTLLLGVGFLIAAVYVEGWVATQPLLPPEMFKQTYMKRLMTALFCLYGTFGLFLFNASF